MTRAEKRRFKYTVIRNITKNPKIAETYKDASEQRIFEELNIVIPKRTIKETGRFETVEDKKLKYEVEGFVYKYSKKGKEFILKTPKLKELDKEKKTKYLRLQENKVKYAVDRGMDLEDANQLRHKTYKQIDKAIQFEQSWTRTRVKGKSKATPEQSKIERFKGWASDDDFPPNFVRKARRINLEKGLDINESFGFAVMYYAYIYNRDAEHFVNQLEYNKATGVVEYKSNMKY
jgi:hypothetical protein